MPPISMEAADEDAAAEDIDMVGLTDIDPKVVVAIIIELDPMAVAARR